MPFASRASRLFGQFLDAIVAFGPVVVLAMFDTFGAPCKPWQSFVRNVLLYILGPIDWVFIFGDRHQRLGDKAAGTVVVEVG